MKKWTGAAIDWFRLVEFRMARGKDAFRFVDASRTCSIFAWKLICGGVWPARESENLKNSPVSIYDDCLAIVSYVRSLFGRRNAMALSHFIRQSEN